MKSRYEKPTDPSAEPMALAHTVADAVERAYRRRRPVPDTSAVDGRLVEVSWSKFCAVAMAATGLVVPLKRSERVANTS